MELFGLNNLEYFKSQLDENSLKTLAQAVKSIVDVKKRGGKITVVTGSGPNIHEGVTTLIAELIRVGIIDCVTTSSAVISHEMGGALDRVFRVDARELSMNMDEMPRGDLYEFTDLSEEYLNKLRLEMPLDEDLLARGKKLKVHSNIIKAAGNMAYPMGLRGERVALEILNLAKIYGVPFEEVAGWGCDERTMLGAAAAKNIPVLVTIPHTTLFRSIL